MGSEVRSATGAVGVKSATDDGARRSGAARSESRVINPASAVPAPRKVSAVATANRLRLLQAELADHDPAMREQLLADELERAMAAIAPSQRLAFLRELGEHFPTWDARVDVAPQTQQAPSRSATDQRELRDPSFLLSRLIEIASKMSPGDRQALIDRLDEAGLSNASGGADWPAPALELFREQTRLPAGSTIQAGRVMELAAMLASFARSLESPLWRTWKDIAPRSALRRTGDLSATIQRFARGDQDVPRGQVQAELEQLRRLTAAIIQAIGHASKPFAHGLRKFSPVEIQAVAQAEKSTFEKIEVACWRKFKELAGDLDESMVESNLRQVVAALAESFVGSRQ